MYKLARLDMFSITTWNISVATRTTTIAGCRKPEFLTPLRIDSNYTLLPVSINMLGKILVRINCSSANQQH